MNNDSIGITELTSDLNEPQIFFCHIWLQTK